MPMAAWIGKLDQQHAKTQGELVGRVEPWVAALPVDFADFIKYEQVAPAAEETLADEDETK